MSKLFLFGKNMFCEVAPQQCFRLSECDLMPWDWAD